MKNKFGLKVLGFALLLSACSKESPELIPCMCDGSESTLGLFDCMCEPAKKKPVKKAAKKTTAKTTKKATVKK